MYLYCLICLIFLYVSMLSAMNYLDMALCKINIIIIIIIIIELTFNERFQNSDIAAAISLGHYYFDTL